MNWMYALDLIGTLVFAISGILIGIEKKMDLIGGSILGLVTAVGGGTLRDVLIGQTPVAWMRDLNYLYIVWGALPLCYFFSHYISKFKRSMFIFDTIGIGLYTILGLQKTLSIGLSPVVAVLMGTVSAVFGGVIRDVLSNEIPVVFRREIYASACLAGGCIFILLEYFHKDNICNVLISMAVVMLIRFLAVRYEWSLQFIPRSSQNKNL